LRAAAASAVSAVWVALAVVAASVAAAEPEPVERARAVDAASAPNPPVIALSDIVKIYRMGRQEVHALRGISMEIRQGEFVAITGASGSGKSTLMHIIGLLDRPTRGHYHLESRDVATLSDDQQAAVRNRSIGFVFQAFNLLARTSALRNVELPLLYAGVRAGERTERARRALEQVGMGNRLNHQPSELSGGQQQRVAIARALVTQPAIILADEPTGNLDTRASHEVMELLRELNHERNMTVVLVTHEEEIASYAGRAVQVRDGLILSDVVHRDALTGAAVAGEQRRPA
jgi:putative ABC transport system ATP-binding protein